jgi:hypothetical protein
MSRWTKGVLGLLFLFQAVEFQAQQTVVTKKDWDLTKAYSDVFMILSEQNACSSFYGGSRVATTVLHDFFMVVKAQPLRREVSFQMVGRPRLLRDDTTGVRYRLFDRAMVNTNGSFYQRRPFVMDRFPSDVGNFGPGTRRARALILLHELGHLIEGEDGTWLLPDDGLNGPQSKANTLRVQQACRSQLKTLN